MDFIDNINKKLGTDLKENIKRGATLSVAASSFSIYSYEMLHKELSKIEELRFIFTSPAFIEESFAKEARKFYIPHIFHEADLCGGEFELRLMSKLGQRAIAKECAEWVRDKVTFKTNRKSTQPLPGFIHLNNDSDHDIAYSNVQGFTTVDLGFSHKPGFPTMIQKTEYPYSAQYLEHFNQIWKDDEALKDVTDEVQEYFRNAYKDNSPEYIYFITLYNIFNEFLDDLSLDNMPNEQLGFKETVVWSKLYNFQQDAVIGAINKLEKYNGCIIADSVGLGKTFSALGVIKYYEMRNKDVLVLCPKKLEDNWNTYRHNDTTNILAGDRLRYDVLFHTDLSRESGDSNGRKLEQVNWGNYGLVVIDESHNFRNNNTVEGKENRYQKLLNKIVKDGIETKVLMLSATPVNNRFNDLRNQLALAYEGNPDNINANLDIGKGIDDVFKSAQKKFNKWTKKPIAERVSDDLTNDLDDDFFIILDSLTIARSRKHITTYYDTSDIGRFPDRNKPVSRRSKLTLDDRVTFSQIAEHLYQLNLSVYTPLNYLLPSKEQHYADLYDSKVRSGTSRLTQKDREGGLKTLMMINLLKRIESSVHSFRLTVQKLNEQILTAQKAIASGEDKEYEGIQAKIRDGSFDMDSDWGSQEGIFGKNVKVHVSDMDVRRWGEDLEQDRIILNQLLELIDGIDGEDDNKLQELLALIDNKVNNPLNTDNKKVIIFTAFADTANYLATNLFPYYEEHFGLHSAVITGSKNQTNAPGVKSTINSLLTCFSPRSKDKAATFPNVNASIDILIATDCISEGQNLQDCDYLINYDIHWNPVRIIQRFGRIDRIGSINDNISLVNFWPDVELDAYINLKSRVESRMHITNMAATGDDNILNQNEKDLEYRKVQLEKLQSEVVDLEDLREGVSITDLGLNDFRIDLSNYFKQYGELRNIPEGLHAIVPSSEISPPGVIFVLKNINTSVNINKSNRLHPYYIVHMDMNGDVIFNHVESKKILDAMRKLCKGNTEPIMSLCNTVNEDTNDYQDMTTYSELLKKSIGSILNKEEEKDIKSLFSSGGTTALTDKIKGLEDFKLISFLIVK